VVRRYASAKPGVLLAVPSEVERAGLRLMIEAESGCKVVAEAADGQSALALAEEHEPEIAVIDGSLADVSALGLVHFLSARCPGTQTLLYTEACDKGWTCVAIREGVRGFVLKSQAGTHLVPAIRALSDRCPYWIGAVDDDALDELLESGERPPRDALSAPEWQVLRMAAEEKTSKEMALTLGLPSETVERYRAQLRRRLGFRNRDDLIRYVALHDGSIG
jgi:DNA-binding NarL/FixJ family response regulator